MWKVKQQEWSARTLSVHNHKPFWNGFSELQNRFKLISSSRVQSEETHHVYFGLLQTCLSRKICIDLNSAVSNKKNKVWAFKSTWAWTHPEIIFRGFFGFFTVQSQISSWLLRSLATDCGLNDPIPLYKQIFRVAWRCGNWTVTSQQEGLELDSTRRVHVLPLPACIWLSGLSGFLPQFRAMQVRLIGVNDSVLVCLSMSTPW